MNIRSLGSALTQSIEGLRRQEQQVAVAVTALNDAFAAVENTASEPPAEVAAPVGMTMAGVVEGDISGPLVNVLAARVSYAAILKVVDVQHKLALEL